MVFTRVFKTDALRRTAAAVLGALLSLSMAADAARAQTGNLERAATTTAKAVAPGQGPAKSAASAAAMATVEQPKWTAEEEAARKAVLDSSAWNDTMRQFEQWLSAQPLYSADEVARTRSRMALGISRMTPAQLQRFLADMQEKIQVLTSPAAQEASAYLAQTFAVASPAYAKRLRQRLPDVLTMTAAQINQQLSIFASKQQATINMQQTFQDSRQRQIANNQQMIAAQQANQAAIAQSGSAAAATATKGNNFTPARDYFPDAGNDGPFGPGTSIGFGWGFF